MKSQINIGINTSKNETFLMLPVEEGVRFFQWSILKAAGCSIGKT